MNLPLSTARALLPSSSTRLSKPHALPVSLNELDSTHFKGGTDFSNRFLSPAQFTLGRLQAGNGWF